ncbi:hypothetical protein pEaSNUABM37_00182 [Erwinia phage pEa_SNUABM_37]|nr:hypothetical protein pEaSNUABM37_00182 [Erwinia phage pEa_SNUABM_37]QXO10652.1 hypothetical protein pEaSNUABM48_00182 [Erwinia phage pEa_SNUABM_48]
MSQATSIEFFKQQELIDAHNLMSTANGEERLGAASAAMYAYFSKLAKNIDLNIKSVIAGWRRGYSPEAVADYLFDYRFDDFARTPMDVANVEPVLRSMFEIMGYPDDYTWGNQYGYYPSLGESASDPLEVQERVNKQAGVVAAAGGFETILFGQYQNGTGALRNDKERPLVEAFRRGVVAALLERRDSFFVTTQFDDGETE